MLIKTSFIFIFLFCCATTSAALSNRYNDGSVFKSTDIETVQESLPPGFDSKDIIYRHLANVLNKRAAQQQTFAVNPQLSTAIVAQIRARIRTQITSKISASVSPKLN
jgi:hypothetical protein